MNFPPELTNCCLKTVQWFGVVAFPALIELKIMFRCQNNISSTFKSASLPVGIIYKSHKLFVGLFNVSRFILVLTDVSYFFSISYWFNEQIWPHVNKQ